ncbi:SDR family oxidoreductase [Pedobacter sp. KACC 23697]|uniref:SDR family oxidoreductase n=1 Tax=Pedobacter sp. KACC 23697 TaxID=3149230 RepID=A0AAU7K8G4_9SPHI
MKNRIAIITGASSGIGRATAIRLAKKGIKLVLNARNEQKLNALKEEINQVIGANICELVCGDVADSQITGLCITAALNRWQKHPDIFVASAGRGLPGTVLTSEASQWDELIDTNVKGTMYQLRNIGKIMLDERIAGGDFVDQPFDIIVIGSSIGRNVSPFNSVYGATKFATHGVTEALRRELGPHGIRVTLIEPGLVSTNFQDTAGYDGVWFEQYSKDVGPVLVGDDVAKVIDFIVDLPGNVHLDNISIRPTRQAYP